MKEGNQMLNPNHKSDRFIYSELLTPPAGYPELEKAVVTTFSLDMNALISCMIPLAFSSDVDSELFKNKISTLTSLKALSDKIAIFCDPSQIKTMKTGNYDFSILLEKMIIPVKLNKKENIYPSFHPKLWILQYTNGSEHFYKIIILSRNISYDKCYDISIVLESASDGDFSKTGPVIDFIEHLSQTTNAQNTSIAMSLIEDLRKEKVAFKVNDNNFNEDFGFIPIYEKTTKSISFTNTVLKNHSDYDSIFIMSPFLSREIIEATNKATDEVILISRAEALTTTNFKDVSETELKEKYKIYTLNTGITESNESKIGDEPDIEAKQEIADEDNLYDIHAKIFVTQKGNHKDFYFGSANATRSAFNKNVEFLLHLSSDSENLSTQSLFRDMNSEKENIFLETRLIEEEGAEKTLLQKLENVIREIAHINANADVKGNNDEWNVTINFDDLPIEEDVEILVAPITNDVSKKIAKTVVFEKLPVTSISHFYMITAKGINSKDKQELNRLIRIQTNNIPELEREQALINNVVKDKESFYEYISLVLSRNPIMTQLEISENLIKGKAWNISNPAMPVYEMLLQACVNNPNAIYRIEDDLKFLKNKDFVNGFKEMHEKFISVLNGLECKE